MKNLLAFTPYLQVGDPQQNARAVCASIDSFDADVIVTPELSLVGATLGDLTRQSLLIGAAMRALCTVAQATRDKKTACLVGLPIAVGDDIYDCVAVVHGGGVLGLVPKQNLTYADRRIFDAPKAPTTVMMGGHEVPMDRRRVYSLTPEHTLGVVVGADPNGIEAKALANAGANLICNVTAMPTLPLAYTQEGARLEALAKRLGVTYAWVNAAHESTTDFVFGGEKVVCCPLGTLASSAPFAGDALSVDLLGKGKPSFVRGKTSKALNPHPFIPTAAAEREALAHETIAIQAHGLAARMQRIGAKRMVLGVSGGLDSTLALLVCVEACKVLGVDKKESITCVTLPCFGTTNRTKSNAVKLCEALGLDCREINIGAAVTQHLWDIGHSLDVTDAAYENAQARMRTMVLMDLANMQNGIVVGTGDLSELALGWCTYNGDHMSMYGVNGTVPKTLIRVIVDVVAKGSPAALRTVLLDILDTPISPELLPNVGGEIAQKTEELVGKYDVNDFLLYHMMTSTRTPAEIFALAQKAFPEVSYDALLAAYRRFLWRFFSQQFKRSCSPDGAKAGAIDLSPRGEWQMPSDISAALWLRDLDELK